MPRGYLNHTFLCSSPTFLAFPLARVNHISSTSHPREGIWVAMWVRALERICLLELSQMNAQFHFWNKGDFSVKVFSLKEQCHHPRTRGGCTSEGNREEGSLPWHVQRGRKVSAGFKYYFLPSSVSTRKALQRQSIAVVPLQLVHKEKGDGTYTSQMEHLD